MNALVKDRMNMVVFLVERQRYGLPLGMVERIIRAVEVTSLPTSPEMVLGAIDVEGRVLPVLNLRRRLGLPERTIHPAQQFVLAKTARRAVALVIDEVLDVVEAPATGIVEPHQVAPGLEHLCGVAQLADGLVLIYDLERFLSLEEERALDRALEEKEAVDAR